jgi:hypothetical protein
VPWAVVHRGFAAGVTVALAACRKAGSMFSAQGAAVWAASPTCSTCSLGVALGLLR